MGMGHHGLTIVHHGATDTTGVGRALVALRVIGHRLHFGFKVY